MLSDGGTAWWCCISDATIVGQIEAVLSLNFTNHFWKISKNK